MLLLVVHSLIKITLAESTLVRL